MKRYVLILLALSACDFNQMADKAVARTAEEVIAGVLGQGMPQAQADSVARCVSANASTAELTSLARDIGVEAGTSTTSTIAAILSRPQTQSCLLSQSLSVPGGLL